MIWLGLVLHTAVRFQTLADGLLQGHGAGGGGVLGLIVDDGLDGGQLDAVRRGEIRFAGGKAQDIDAVRLHLLIQGVHGQGGGFVDLFSNAR